MKVSPNSALLEHLVELQGKFRVAGIGNPSSINRITEHHRRVEQLETLDAKGELEGPATEALLAKAGQLSADLVRALRLPESLLEPLRQSKLVAVGYAEVGQRTATHRPLPARNVMTVQFGQALRGRRAHEFPEAYTPRHRNLLPTPTEPLPSMWEHEVPSDPLRKTTPGIYFAGVDLKSLPTLPVEECLHRLLFARSIDQDSNWASDPLFDPYSLKLPSQDFDPMVQSLMRREAQLPESFGRKELGGLFKYKSTRGLFPVVEELLDAADENGNVDLARLFTHYHRQPLPPRHEFTERLARALVSPVEDPERPIATNLPQSGRTYPDYKGPRPLCETWEELTTILTAFERRFPTLTTSYLERSFGWPAILPALDIAARDVPADQFDDCVLLCAQHLIPSQLPLFDELIAHGAEASDVFVAGVPYSTNPLVAGMLRARGMSVVESEGNATNILGNYEDARIEELRPTIEAAVEQARASGKKLLVLDDGGIVARMLHEEHPDIIAQTRLVEQTTRGLTENSRIELGCPGVGVAKCEAKDEEAPFVAEDMLAELCELLPTQGINSLEGVGITIVGNGPIGGSMAEACRRAGMDVRMVDIDEEAREAAVTAGLPRDKVFSDVTEAAAGSQIVIGCTGHKSLPREVLEKLPDNVIVASGSSAEIELDTEFLVHNGEHRLREQVQTYWVGNKRIRLANGGRPLNFDNTRDGDPEKVQLTRALMFQAAVQASEIPNGTAPGFTNLTKKRQKPIVEYMRDAVWSSKPPFVPTLVPRHRDETVWADVETAFARGRDFGDLLADNDGDKMFWMRSMLRAAPVCLNYGFQKDANPDRSDRGHPVIQAPNGRLYIAAYDDPSLPPFIELPFNDQTPVRIETIQRSHDRETMSTEDLVLWLDDERGRRTAHHLRFQYKPEYDEKYGVWPKQYGRNGTPVPKAAATLIGSYPDAALVSEHAAYNSQGRAGHGVVLASPTERVRIDANGDSHVLDDQERWFGPVCAHGRTVSLEHTSTIRVDRGKPAPRPHSIELPESIVAVEDAFTAISKRRVHDHWPHLSPDDVYRTSSLLICRNRDGGRVAVNVNWRMAKVPGIAGMQDLPEGALVRHAEPYGGGDRRTPTVEWQVFTHVPGDLDERGAWPVTRV